jgi:lysyl endopeptidase
MKQYQQLTLAGILLFLLVVALGLPHLTAASTAVDTPAQANLPDGLVPGLHPLSEVDVLTLPAVDNQALLEEDARNAGLGAPNRFAIPFTVDVTTQNRGDWETAVTGDLVWRLRILSPDAYSLNLGFSQYHLPEGARLTIYTPDFTTVRGPFTAADNDAHGEFWTPILMGNEMVLELVVPPARLAELKLEVTSVNHGYTSLKQAQSPVSGSCNLDVVCSAADGYPQVDPWRDQIRSSGVYTVNGTWTCSGALVNNTAQDMKPYFLTADHCSVSSGNAASVVVYWNFENSTCRQPGSPASGGPGDGSLAQFNSGAIFRADYSPSDVTLIEMDDPIDPVVDAYWSGWDARSGDFSAAIAIHHPNTDEKRISFEDSATTTTSYLGTAVPGDSTHIRVIDWDLGTTEPGSSGSPLYNPDQRIVGQLHGGYAACGNDSSDWYGRLSISWAGGGTAATRLSNWLDPLGTGVLYLDGRSTDTTPDFELTATPASLDVCIASDASYTVNVGQNYGYTDLVTLSASGNPAGTTTSFSVNPVTPPGSSQLTIGNTAAAATGSYMIDIVGVALTSTHTTTVQLDLYDTLTAVPNPAYPGQWRFRRGPPTHLHLGRRGWQRLVLHRNRYGFGLYQRGGFGHRQWNQLHAGYASLERQYVVLLAGKSQQHLWR